MDVLCSYMVVMGTHYDLISLLCLRYIIIYYHGDFEEDHLPHNQESSGWMPCVWQINNFASVFLFR